MACCTMLLNDVQLCIRTTWVGVPQGRRCFDRIAREPLEFPEDHKPCMLEAFHESLSLVRFHLYTFLQPCNRPMIPGGPVKIGGT